MSNRHILDQFKQHHELIITKPVLQQLDSFCRGFETKRGHAQALHTLLLGVHDIHFLPEDEEHLFHIFGVDSVAFRRTISIIPTINPAFKVSSNPYNLLTVWAAHNVINARGISQHDQEQGLLNLFKMMHYRFFTSLMFRNFPYGADAATMTEAVRRLTNKYDVVKAGTWAKAIEERSRDVYHQGSIHRQALIRFDDDKKVIYVISDTHTRLNQKITLVTSEYYNVHQEGAKIGSYSHVGTDGDGDKVVNSMSDKYDVMIANLSRQVMSVPTFVDPPLTRYVSGMFFNVRTDMFRVILVKFSEMATVQAHSGQLDEVVRNKQKEEVYTGARKLIQELIQKTLRLCEQNGRSMRNKTDIIISVKNIYSSSRVANDDILTIKRSVQSFVMGCGESTREATIASLVICFILYIIIRALDYHTA